MSKQEQSLFAFCSMCGQYLKPDEGKVDVSTGEILCGVCSDSEPCHTVEQFEAKYRLNQPAYQETVGRGYIGQG